MAKVKSTKSAELLLEYQRYLDKRVLELRAEACELAAKSRAITDLVPVEQQKDVEDQKEADESWSFNNGLVDILQEGKKKAVK